MGDPSSCLLTHVCGGTPRSGRWPRWEVQHGSTACPEHGPGVDSQAVEGLVPLSLWGGELGTGSVNSLRAQLREACSEWDCEFLCFTAGAGKFLF